VSLGACITHAAIEDGLVPDPSRGLMPKVASSLAYRAVRNRGTIGGSLALSDPAAEWPTVLSALDGRAILQAPAGQRAVRCAEFTTGVYETKLGTDEIVHSVAIPKLSATARWGYQKFCQKSGEFAKSIAAAVHDPSRRYARAVLGAANGAPIMLRQTSEYLLGGRAGVEELRVAIAADLDAAGDRRFEDFQRSIHAATVFRAVSQALA
jgi:carbon-monoxide dehydrogenase medium subunit